MGPACMCAYSDFSSCSVLHPMGPTHFSWILQLVWPQAWLLSAVMVSEASLGLSSFSVSGKACWLHRFWRFFFLCGERRPRGNLQAPQTQKSSSFKDLGSPLGGESKPGLCPYFLPILLSDCSEHLLILRELWSPWPPHAMPV